MIHINKAANTVFLALKSWKNILLNSPENIRSDLEFDTLSASEIDAFMSALVFDGLLNAKRIATVLIALDLLKDSIVKLSEDQKDELCNDMLSIQEIDALCKNLSSVSQVESIMIGDLPNLAGIASNQSLCAAEVNKPQSVNNLTVQLTK